MKKIVIFLAYTLLSKHFSNNLFLIADLIKKQQKTDELLKQ